MLTSPAGPSWTPPCSVPPAGPVPTSCGAGPWTWCATAAACAAWPSSAAAGASSSRAGVVIAADGAMSRLARAAGLATGSRGVIGYAARAERRSDRPDDRFLEVYPELVANDELVPAYGWVFPLGGGVVNVGVGFVTTSRSWRSIRVPVLVRQLMAQLPPEWNLGDGDAVLADPSFAGWKLPMGLTAAPLWRPGLVVCGDAAGVAKPFTGAGISKAIQSGMLAGEAADRAAHHGPAVGAGLLRARGPGPVGSLAPRRHPLRPPDRIAAGDGRLRAGPRLAAGSPRRPRAVQPGVRAGADVGPTGVSFRRATPGCSQPSDAGAPGVTDERPDRCERSERGRT